MNVEEKSKENHTYRTEVDSLEEDEFFFITCEKCMGDEVSVFYRHENGELVQLIVSDSDLYGESLDSIIKQESNSIWTDCADYSELYDEDTLIAGDRVLLEYCPYWKIESKHKMEGLDKEKMAKLCAVRIKMEGHLREE